MRGLKDLSSGLIIAMIVAATVFGALVLSIRGQPMLISELPIPTATIQTTITPLIPTHSATRPAVTAVIVTPSLSPTPTPTVCPIPTDWQRYSVGPFDTLDSITQRFNLTADQLVRTNCLSDPRVVAGQTIYVPPFRPTATTVPCFPPYNWARYIVQPGETLGSIAYRYGISVYTLMLANCLSTSYIYYGQVLYVPPVFPIVTLPPTLIPPTFTPTPPIGSLTPTIPPSVTPTILPTTPAVTDTPSPTDTPVPSDTPVPTVAPSDTPPPTLAPTEPPTVAPTVPPPTTAPTTEPVPTVNPTP